MKKKRCNGACVAAGIIASIIVLLIFYARYYDTIYKDAYLQTVAEGLGDMASMYSEAMWHDYQLSEQQYRQLTRALTEQAYLIVKEAYSFAQNEPYALALVSLQLSQMAYDPALYIFVVSEEGTILIGTEYFDEQLFKEGFEALKRAKNTDGMYVTYKWFNPHTGQVEQKTSYVKYFAEWGLYIGCGYYTSMLLERIKPYYEYASSELLRFAKKLVDLRQNGYVRIRYSTPFGMTTIEVGDPASEGEVLVVHKDNANVYLKLPSSYRLIYKNYPIWMMIIIIIGAAWQFRWRRKT